MTKVTILEQSHEDVKPKKKIEFVKYINDSFTAFTDDAIDLAEPKDWGYIDLICKNPQDCKYDVMFVTDYEDRRTGYLVLGHFNDGEV